MKDDRMKQLAWQGMLLFLFGVFSSPAGFSAEAPSAVSPFRVPSGFTVELVAAAPLVQHPLMAGFDDRGRLFVADNAGLNLPAEELLEQLPNMVRRLEDTDGDGRFDRSTLFADKMTFPQGAAWYRGALYVASPPSIWRLEDTDGDGVADRRDEIVQKFGFIGNAADIHGCFITPTGRIAWCDGRHGHEFKDQAGQTASQGLAARVFSCRPDGGNVEVFCGGGMDNPVEVAFTAEGDTIGTMTFYNPDDARHDALVHFVHGGVYPRKHPCTSEFKRTGELMPALSRFGVVAPSGLARYAGAAWGEEFRDNLFSVQFNTHKIVRHVLSRQGATFSSVDEDFLVSTNADFHPTDVLQDADGSLLVIDTGGWFRIGCPTSQIAKPEVGGGIYRIRRTGAPIADARGLRIDWATTSNIKLCDLLSDPRPAVAERAVEVLSQRGDASTGALATPLFDDPDYRARQNAVWTLARIGSETALLLLRQALGDDDALVRQAAVHAVSDLRDAESLLPLIDILAHDEPAVRREAATALGRLRQAKAVPALLEALRQSSDRFVEHALIYALIEINDPGSTLAGLSHESASVRRGALVALDQMDAGPLTRPMVAPLLATDDAALLRTLVEILAKHPDWADELTSTIGAWLAQSKPSAEQLATARGAVGALIQRPDVQKSVIDFLAGHATCKDTRLMLLEVIAADEHEELNSLWTGAVRPNLESPDADVLRQAIATASVLDAKVFAERFSEIGLDAKQPAPLRVAALCAAARSRSGLSEPAFTFLSAQLVGPGDLRDRLAAAEALGEFDLNAAQRAGAARLAEHCGPLEVSWLLRAFEHDTTASTGLALVDSLTKSPALASLSGDRLREVFKNYPPEVQSAARTLLARTAPDDQERTARLKSLEVAVQDGEAARGEEVFFGTRAACSACHRIAGRGEKIGPDLSKIGEVRNRRDLLEAVVFPSASLARGYESLSIATKDGKVHSGLLSRETATAVYLRTIDRTEIRVERGDIDELSPSRTSIMPQGLDKALSIPELRDVIAYLETLK
jgi:putative membrane-bound dehydrogenase-like protein